MDAAIYYVLNLHESKACAVESFDSLEKAKFFAEQQSVATGCTFVVCEGVEWHQPKANYCPHTENAGESWHVGCAVCRDAGRHGEPVFGISWGKLPDGGFKLRPYCEDHLRKLVDDANETLRLRALARKK